MMGYYNDSSGEWRKAAEKHAATAAYQAWLGVGFMPLLIAIVAVAVGVSGLAGTYVAAWGSLRDLHGARWAVAVAFLVGVHLWGAVKLDRFVGALRAGLRTHHPVSSRRELRADLNSRRAWLPRLLVAIFAVFAAAHLLAIGRPAVVVWGVPLAAVLSLDILGWGTWPARRIVDWLRPNRDAP